MNCQVDDRGRALLPIAVRRSKTAECFDLPAWIDTGFNGELVLPQQIIDRSQLEQSGTVRAILGDGKQVALRTYTCWIDWFGEQRKLEVVANEGEFPLLGVGLLLGFDLHVSYRSGEITVD